MTFQRQASKQAGRVLTFFDNDGEKEKKIGPTTLLPPDSFHSFLKAIKRKRESGRPGTYVYSITRKSCLGKSSCLWRLSLCQLELSNSQSIAHNSSLLFSSHPSNNMLEEMVLNHLKFNNHVTFKHGERALQESKGTTRMK